MGLKPLTLYVGVDPGMGGGLAVVSRNGSVGAVAMPRTERDVWDWFRSVRESSGETVRAVIERVHAMPGNGVSGMFRFGQSFGSLRMALTASGVSWEEAQPRAWQKAMGLTARDNKGGESQTAFKNRMKALAQQIFPKVKVTLAVADALLIAEFCRRKHEGRLG